MSNVNKETKAQTNESKKETRSDSNESKKDPKFEQSRKEVLNGLEKRGFHGITAYWAAKMFEKHLPEKPEEVTAEQLAEMEPGVKKTAITNLQTYKDLKAIADVNPKQVVGIFKAHIPLIEAL